MSSDPEWYRDHGLLLSRLKETTPAANGPQDTNTTESQSEHHTFPSRIGRLHVKRVIASGGMGTVYEAMQEHPRRSVAVKVMKHDIASRSAMRRFEYESQVLARLRHPGIAQIYEAGTHDDGGGPVPFFAMEYIPGAKPITQHAAQKKLSTRQRLELFAQVCEAIHHGHQKGVIHRDLKPSNILVDQEGHTKVIDFGVARGTDSDMAVTTLHTSIGHLIGTLQYMSPEQCNADPSDLDIRSDVYALGVVLYELLSERLPCDVSNKPVIECTRVIREQQPTRLSTVNATLKGDTETIVLKALEKDRERRYQSATELARDIRRYLAGEAIAARPPSVAYQFRVFARRNKAACAAVVIVFVVLVAASIVSTSLYLKADAARANAVAARTAEEEQCRLAVANEQLARQRERDAESQRQRAEANFQKARDAVDQMLTRVAEELESRPHMQRARRELLEDALAFYEQFLEQEGNDPAVRFEAGRAYGRAALINEGLGNRARAEDAYGKALNILEELARDYDQPEHHVALADAYSALAAFVGRAGVDGAGRLPEAEQYVRKALAIRQWLADESPDNPEYRKALASNFNDLVIVLGSTGRFGEAEEVMQRSQSLLEQLTNEYPNEPEYRAELARVYGNLGALFSRSGRMGDMELAYRQAIALMEQVVSQRPERGDACWRRGARGHAHQDARRHGSGCRGGQRARSGRLRVDAADSGADRSPAPARNTAAPHASATEPTR